jgi:hypothetical protein
MRVIVKRLNMETIQDTYLQSRRSFFVRLFSGVAGGWIAGNLLSRIVRTKTISESTNVVQVTINPFAVPRTKKDTISHGV